MSKFNHIRKYSGVTLLELVIVIVILGISLLPMTALFTQALTNATNAKIMTTMNYIAQFTMESMLTAKFSDLIVGDAGSAYNYADRARIPIYFGTYLNKFRYTCRVYAINPTYNGDLSTSSAEITRPSGTGMNKYGIKGSYLRIYVKVENDIMPEKIVELWTIVTPRGQGY